MFRWLYILPHLLVEANAARRDTRIRFLNAQVRALVRSGHGRTPFGLDSTGMCQTPTRARHACAQGS